MRNWFKIIAEWIHNELIEVLLIDTANDFFRGLDNPSEERVVRAFFDQLRNLDVGGRMLVRHDRKLKAEEDSASHSNERIRGSGEWKEDPETILMLERRDRRTNEVRFEVGKLRYGRKPEPLTLWFDARSFRLEPLPPVISVLRQGAASRQEIVQECSEVSDFLNVLLTRWLVA